MLSITKNYKFPSRERERTPKKKVEKKGGK